MLTSKCIHPDLVRVLSKMGHGDKLLIADGNYPLDSKTGTAEKVWLGLRPGNPEVTDVLETILQMVNIEHAEVMENGTDEEPEIFHSFRKILNCTELEKHDRYDFYRACEEEPVKLAISTGEKRTFANILLTIGVA